MNNQPTIQLPPMIVAGSIWFAPQAILAIDFSGYATTSADRSIAIFLVGPHELELVAEDADAFKAWWNQITGQNKVQPVPAGIRLT